jgi:hypothetical protein
MTIWSESATARPARTVSRAGAWGLVLAVFYAVFVRFYQAAGGTVGMGGSVPRGLPNFQFASFLAGVLILLGGAACVVLTSPQLRRAPTSLPVIGGREVSAALVIPLCAAPTLLGGLYAIIHGIGGMVTKLLGLLGIVEIPFPAEAWVTVDMVALSLWDLLFYEPWFLAMGLCLLLSLRSYALDKGVRPGAVRAAGRACAALVAVGSAGFMWMIVTDNVVVI